MDTNTTPTAGYTQHSCMGGCVGGYDSPAAGSVPTLEEIAGYNTMTQQQKDQIRQQLYQTNQEAFSGMPWSASYRAANNSNAQQAGLLSAASPSKKQAATGTPAVPGTLGTSPGTSPGMQTTSGGTAGAQGMQTAPAAQTQTIEGTTSAPMIPGQPAPITPLTQPAPITGESLQYLNGFLRTQIGRAVKVEFLIGTNTLVDRTGILLGVGANYILINEAETDDIVACDFYNIKFVQFYY